MVRLSLIWGLLLLANLVILGSINLSFERSTLSLNIESVINFFLTISTGIIFYFLSLFSFKKFRYYFQINHLPKIKLNIDFSFFILLILLTALTILIYKHTPTGNLAMTTLKLNWLFVSLFFTTIFVLSSIFTENKAFLISIAMIWGAVSLYAIKIHWLLIFLAGILFIIKDSKTTTPRFAKTIFLLLSLFIAICLIYMVYLANISITNFDILKLYEKSNLNFDKVLRVRILDKLVVVFALAGLFATTTKFDFITPTPNKFTEILSTICLIIGVVSIIPNVFGIYSEYIGGLFLGIGVLFSYKNFKSYFLMWILGSLGLIILIYGQIFGILAGVAYLINYCFGFSMLAFFGIILDIYHKSHSKNDLTI